jgi:hypothetical protein
MTDDLEAARQRRKAFEKGQRSADAHVAVLRHELRRWRLEAEWWKEEYRLLHDEYCAFIAELAQGGP